MRNIGIGLAVLGIVLVLGCAGRTNKTKTTHDESAEHGHMPEPPKSRADHLDRELDAE
jgi:hypothetical protein